MGMSCNEIIMNVEMTTDDATAGLIVYSIGESKHALTNITHCYQRNIYVFLMRYRDAKSVIYMLGHVRWYFYEVEVRCEG